MRLTIGVVEVLPNQAFDVIVANFSRRERRLTKHTVVGYAKRNPLAILTPERRVAEGIAHALHLTDLTDQVGEVGVGRPNSDEGAAAENREVGTDERPPQGQPTAGGTVCPQKKDPGNPPMDWEKEIDLSYIDDDKLRDHVLEMLRKHSSLWSGALGMIRATEHRIPLEPETKPIRSLPYRKGPAMREMVAKEVNKMLNAGVIAPASTEWASPVVLVQKKDGSLRFCVDYRRLNAKTASDSYPLLRMDDCIDSLGDAAVFTTLDCKSGYWQISVAPEDRDKTKFTMHMGTSRHLRMPFGLKGAPATFQRAFNIILSGVRWQICLVYLDDFIVLSRSHGEHAKHLDTVLSLLRSAGISLKLKKCSFFQPKVHYLGHVISPGKLSVAEAAADAFKTFTFPRTLTQVRSFLGACNVYRRFVKGFAKIARPLSDMTHKDADPDFDNPTELQLQAFEALKERMV